ncbi:hypothetical protein M2H13_23295, partial [Vibrio vulnificus]|nr:hypothetical protein [Vibrio vulnificus]
LKRLVMSFNVSIFLVIPSFTKAISLTAIHMLGVRVTLMIFPITVVKRVRIRIIEIIYLFRVVIIAAQKSI